MKLNLGEFIKEKRLEKHLTMQQLADKFKYQSVSFHEIKVTSRGNIEVYGQTVPYAKFEAKANDCDINTINAWRNEVLANVATVLMSKKENDESHLRMGVETPDNTPKSLWDRM